MTKLIFLLNHDLKKLMIEIKKINKLSTTIPTINITELKKLIYGRVELVCDTIGIYQRNLNKNTKPGWEIRLVGQIKKLWQQVNVLRKEKHARIYWNEKTKNKTTDKSESTTWDKSKDISKRETQKISGQGQEMQTKQDLPK